MERLTYQLRGMKNGNPPLISAIKARQINAIPSKNAAVPRNACTRTPRGTDSAESILICQFATPLKEASRSTETRVGFRPWNFNSRFNNCEPSIQNRPRDRHHQTDESCFGPIARSANSNPQCKPGMNRSCERNSRVRGGGLVLPT